MAPQPDGAPGPASRSRMRLWIALAAIALAALPVAGWLAWRGAVALLERELLATLGPGARVESVQANASGVELRGLALPGGDGWPAAESLRAERIHVVPSWRSVLSRDVRIARVDLEGLALSAVRSRDGRLRLLPTLLERPSASPAGDAPADTAANAPGRTLRIDEIHVTGGEVELYDETVARKPWKVRLTGVESSVRNVGVPSLAERTPIELRGALDGPERDGAVSIDGWIEPLTGDLALRGSLTSVDLLALQPYLTEASKVRLSHGTLDLSIDAKLHQRVLNAPGRLTLSNLAFAPGTGATARLLGVPRDALLAGLRAQGGRIALDFVVAGNVDDPKFSLNEAFGTRVAIALAKQLGLSVGGLVGGTIGLGIESVQGAERAAGGVGSALKKLLPGR